MLDIALSESGQLPDAVELAGMIWNKYLLTMLQ